MSDQESLPNRSFAMVVTADAPAAISAAVVAADEVVGVDVFITVVVDAGLANISYKMKAPAPTAATTSIVLVVDPDTLFLFLVIL